MQTKTIISYYRFLVELCTFVGIGYWIWHLGEGLLFGALALIVPLVLALLWNALAVPGDPQHIGKAAIPVPGILRLIMELVFYICAVVGLFTAGQAVAGSILVCLTLILYAFTYRRLLWLVRQ